MQTRKLATKEDIVSNYVRYQTVLSIYLTITTSFAFFCFAMETSDTFFHKNTIQNILTSKFINVKSYFHIVFVLLFKYIARNYVQFKEV